jgi:hypothetical protein
LILGLGRISLAGFIAAVLGTIILFAAVGETRLPQSGLDWEFVSIVFFISFVVCWMSLAVAIFLLRRPQVPRWIWRPVPASALGGACGLIMGWPLLAALYPFPPWAGGALGAFTGLAASLLARPAAANG